MDTETRELLREASRRDVDMLALDPAMAARLAQLVSEFLRLEPGIVEAIESADAGAGWRDAISDGIHGHPKVNPWLAERLDAYYQDRDEWRRQRDLYAKGYATEEAEFAELYPPPRFKDHLEAASAHRVVLTDDSVTGPWDVTDCDDAPSYAWGSEQDDPPPPALGEDGHLDDET